MYSELFICLSLMLMGLITGSSEDCHTFNKYIHHCEQRDFDGDCNYFRQKRLVSTHCSQLSNLRVHYEESPHILEIFDSHLDEMTSGAFHLFENLEGLTIYNSNIYHLETGLFNGVHLLNLNLSHNSIQTISKGIFNAMYTLISLDLSSNSINLIDNGSFTGMDNLEELYLNDNKISNIPILTKCINLRVLNIFNNEINKLDVVIQCSNIETLNISGNNIEYLDNTAFNALSSLYSLDLSNNVIKFIHNDTFTGTKKLSKLYLNDNRISDIPLLVHCPNLTTLDISKNEINNLAVLQHLSNLTILNLSRNPLFNETDMPLDLFRNVQLLKSLNLSSTSIKKLSVGSFSGLTYLKILDLSVNSLTYIPKGIFHDLIDLVYLYINNNQLSHFEYDGFSKLQEINLNNNIWNCHTLSDIIKRFNEVQIIRGIVYNATNVYGIACYEETKDFQNLPEYNSSILNGLDKEYLSYIIKSKNDVSKALVQLGNSLNQIISNRNDQNNNKLAETFKDFKLFLNETNLYQKNYSENHWKTLEKHENSLQNSKYNIEEVIGKIANAIALTQNRTEVDIKQIILSFQNAQIQKELTQTNYSIDHWSKLNTLQHNILQSLKDIKNTTQNNIQQSLTDIKNILSTSKAVSQPLIADPKYITNSEQLKIYDQNSLGKSIAIPLYCVLVVLCAMFFLLLSNQIKKFKRIRSDRIECNSLSTLQV